ncbi:MAG: HDIG domain-containing protein [Anaerolineae bacterium]|nr:HDIG domain-containing protein [Anaerolineae bacterium]
MPTNKADQSFPHGKHEQPWPPLLRAALFCLAFTLLTALTLGFHLLPTARVKLDVGDVCPRDIRAPERKTFVSQIRTDEARARAEASVPEVYDAPDQNVARQQIAHAQQILDFIDSVRYDGYATDEERARWLNAIESITLSSPVISKILSMPEDSWQTVKKEVIHVLDQAMRAEIREGQLSETKRTIPTLVSLDLSEDQVQVVVSLTRDLIQPNAFYNAERTAEARQAARDAVQPVQRTIEKGEVILREGDLVTPLAVEALDAYNLRQPASDWRDIASTAIFAAGLTVALALYISAFNPALWRNWRRLALLFLLLSLFVPLAKVMVPGRVGLPYLYPLPTLAMLIAVLLDTRLGIVVAALLSLLLGYVGNADFALTAYGFLGSVVGALSLRRVERLSTFFWAGVYIILTNLLSIAVFRLPDRNLDLVGIGILLVGCVGNGLLSTSLTLGGYYLLGSLFDITTALQLLELARPTHPLMRQLLLKAPGTYHHSILVSNMAEQAAERIGADALLARVGAFYHDIGKIARPYFFAENQVEGVNVHSRLDPYTSAEIITSHVKDGLDLAKKYRLPRKVNDFIAQHHGTGLASYFYRQAVEQDGEENVNPDDFRYPGPKPQSRETAIVMLADACEATVRASRPATSEELEKMVRQIILDRLLEGDLDECDLTLRDLDRISEVFVSILQGLFHPRIKYPPQKQPRLTVTRVALPSTIPDEIIAPGRGDETPKADEELADSDQRRQ